MKVAAAEETEINFSQEAQKRLQLFCYSAAAVVVVLLLPSQSLSLRYFETQETAAESSTSL
jgi:hypothetical protein